MNELYDKWREKGYCLAKDRVYNVQEGGMMSAPVPLCEKSDVVMHTHPLWAEKWANFVDVWVWEEYHRRYEGKRFGIMTGRDEWIMYEKEELP
jgi:hypothetical protein